MTLSGPTEAPVTALRTRRVPAKRLPAKSHSGRRGLWISIVILAVMTVGTVAAPLFAPYSPYDFTSTALARPSAQHWFGTDSLGRDVLSRTMYGGRVALTIAPAAAVIGAVGGAILAALGVHWSSWLDRINVAVINVLLPIPSAIMLLIIVTGFGAGRGVLIAGLAVVYGSQSMRITRARAQEVEAQDYVLAARSRGESPLAIVARDLLPNMIDIIVVEVTLRTSFAILIISSLAFLGVGVDPPTADWGLMVAENRSSITIAPWATIAPLAAFSLLVVTLNVLGDRLVKHFGVDRLERVA